MNKMGTISQRAMYLALRVLAAVMTLVAGLAITYACVTALLGDQDMLIDFIDEDATTLVMDVPTTVAVVATNLTGLFSLGLLFFSLNRFLNHAGRGELLIDSARNALRRLGVALLMIYLTTRFLIVVVPILGMPGFWAANGLSLAFVFIDLDFLFLLVGVVLLVLGQALREGQAAKEEAKQYV